MEKHAVPKKGKIKGGGKMKPILIVEDETVMRESLQDWLTDIGYQVETAVEGEQALKAIGEQDFGVAVLDLKLPGRDGIQVLREAKATRPQLRGIIITAYPSLESAVEAGKEGAVDYLPKPLDLNHLEKLIRDILGPVQVEIKGKGVTEEAVAEQAIVEETKVKEVAVEEAKPEEVIAIAPQEIPVHLKQGKAHFEAGRYGEALVKFESILKVAPGNIESRVWLRKAKQALAEPMAEGVAEEAKPKYCVWMSMGMVSYRICTNNYDCTSCEFNQMMMEQMASSGTSEFDEALTKFKELPGDQRLCRYARKGDVSYRLCTRLFQCANCEFGQMMEDAFQQQLAQREAELAARQEALRKKRQNWWWSYWEPDSPARLARSYSSN
jgi:DNA-binding response OmpR family regulator